MLLERYVSGPVRLATYAGVFVTLTSCGFPDFVFDTELSAGSDGGESNNTSVEPRSSGAPVISDATIGSGATGTEGGSGDSGSTNTPTPADANADTSKQGIRFEDDFESRNASRWRHEKLGTWQIVSLGGNHVYEQPYLNSYAAMSAADSTEWGDQVLEAKVRVGKFGTTDDSSFVAIYGRYLNLNNAYGLALRADGKVALRTRVGGESSWLAVSASAPIETGVWYSLRLEILGDSMRAWVDGVQVLEARDAALTRGTIALGTTSGTAQFDDVRVTVR